MNGALRFLLYLSWSGELVAAVFFLALPLLRKRFRIDHRHVISAALLIAPLILSSGYAVSKIAGHDEDFCNPVEGARTAILGCHVVLENVLGLFLVTNLALFGVFLTLAILMFLFYTAYGRR